MVVGDVVMVTIDVKCRRKNRLKQKKILKTFLNAIIMFIIVLVIAARLIAENRLTETTTLSMSDSEFEASESTTGLHVF